MNSSRETTANPDILMCVLSYLGFLALIPYFAKRDDSFIAWHAKQGLLITATALVVYFILFVISMVPGIGMIAMLLNMLFALTLFGVSIYCIIQACGGNRWPVPVLSAFVEKVPNA